MTDSAAETLDRSALDRLVRFGGSKLLTDMIRIFLTDAPVRIAAARVGASAGDAAAVCRALHALKSSAGQLGAHVMMARCETGERLASLGDRAALHDAVADVEIAFAAARSRLEGNVAALSSALTTSIAVDPTAGRAERSGNVAR